MPLKYFFKKVFKIQIRNASLKKVIKMQVQITWHKYIVRLG